MYLHAYNMLCKSDLTETLVTMACDHWLIQPYPCYSEQLATVSMPWALLKFHNSDVTALAKNKGKHYAPFDIQMYLQTF